MVIDHNIGALNGIPDVIVPNIGTAILQPFHGGFAASTGMAHVVQTFHMGG